METSWYHIPAQQTSWLVDGLIPSDGHVAVCGKPKAGKSTLIRQLSVCVIKRQKFLGRSIDIPAGTGKVLYVHLDRKDQPWRVAQEFRELGITEAESNRLLLRTAADMPLEWSQRIDWLQHLVVQHQPHLIVIDLLWQFVSVENNNAYNVTLDKINNLQDALSSIKYKGALVVALHGRKATNPDDPADDIVGSTAQRGSFVTIIVLARHRQEDRYTITSDQTIRDDTYGEIDETILIKNSDGFLELGTTIRNIKVQEKQAQAIVTTHHLTKFISNNPGCNMDQIMQAHSISKGRALDLLEQAPFIYKKGQGVKGDPFRYFVQADSLESQAQLDASCLMGLAGNLPFSSAFSAN